MREAQAFDVTRRAASGQTERDPELPPAFAGDHYAIAHARLKSFNGEHLTPKAEANLDWHGKHYGARFCVFCNCVSIAPVL